MKSLRILLVGLFLILGAWALAHMEIGGWDEGLYTRRAYIPEFLAGDWAPVYSFYLALFRPFAPETLWVFYLSRGFSLFVLLPVSLYYFARTLTRDSEFALLSALGIPLMTVILQLDPGVHVFNASVIALLFVALSERRRWFFDVILFVALGSLPFLRQENALYFCALLGLALWVNPKRGWILPVSVSAFALLQWRLGSPYSDKRSLYAFCDHWFWNHGFAQGGGENRERVQRILEKFGHPESLRQLILTHFEEVLPYLANNALGLLRQLWNIVWDWRLLPSGLLIFIIRKARGTNFERPHGAWYFIVLAVFLKSVILCSLLAPRQEYFVDLYILAAMISVRVFMAALPARAHGLPLMAALLVFIWWPLRTWSPATLSRDSLFAIREILKRELPAPLEKSPFLGTETQIVYLGPHPWSFTVFGLHQKKPVEEGGGSYKIAELAERFKLSAVVIGPEFMQVAREIGVAGAVAEFEKDPGPFRLLVSGNSKIYIRERPAKD